MMRPNLTRWIAALHLGVYLLVSNAIAQEKPFRPEAGKFPPLAQAHGFRGELTFVDHANRRGRLRIQSEGTYFRTAPRPSLPLCDLQCPQLCLGNLGKKRFFDLGPSRPPGLGW